MDLNSLLIFPCLSISITLCTLRFWVKNDSTTIKVRMINSFKPDTYCPVSSAFNILKPSHSKSFETKKISVAQQPKWRQKGMFTIMSFTWFILSPVAPNLGNSQQSNNYALKCFLIIHFFLYWLHIPLWPKVRPSSCSV